MELERNKCVSVLASAVRAATNNSDNQINEHGRGAIIFIDMTAVPGVDTVTFTVEGYDPITQKYYTILATTALVAVATTVLKIYPGLTAAANLVANDVLPRAWRVRATHSAGTNFTYAVSATLML